MPVVEVSIVIGLIASWAVRKARRAGGRLDETADAAVDAVTDRLDELVRTKLAGHPALRDLDEEVKGAPAGDGESSTGDAAAAPGDAVSDLTKEQLESSLQAAIAKDRTFADQLAALVAELRALTPQPDGAPASGVSMTATAFGQGRVYQAARDQHIGGR